MSHPSFVDHLDRPIDPVTGWQSKEFYLHLFSTRDQSAGALSNILESG